MKMPSTLWLQRGSIGRCAMVVGPSAINHSTAACTISHDTPFLAMASRWPWNPWLGWGCQFEPWLGWAGAGDGHGWASTMPIRRGWRWWRVPPCLMEERGMKMVVGAALSRGGKGRAVASGDGWKGGGGTRSSSHGFKHIVSLPLVVDQF